MNLEIFKNSGFELRGGLINNEPYFVAMDISKALGYSDTEAMTRRLDNDEIQNLQIVGFGNRGVSVINESGLYNAILSSKKKEAKEFKKWVTSEVLPSIRKNGMYATAPTLENMINNPDFAISLLTKLKEEQELRRVEKELRQKEEEKNKELTLQIQIEKPLTDFGRAISQSVACVSVGAFAKSIESDLKVKFGRNTCFEWLRENGYLMSSKSNKNQPYQKWINEGIFETTQGLRQNSTFQTIDITTLITGKGQEYLFNKIKSSLNSEKSK